MTAEFSYQIRVYYEDTDAGGVVFYANYLRFMERARTEWLRDRGFDHKTLKEEHGILFAVRKLNIDYKKPAVLDDLLTITSRLLSRGGASLTFEQTINNNKEVITRAEIKVACLNVTTLKSSPIPEALITEFS